MKAFEGAIHLAKEATENIFTKVEETAVSVIASTILGTDERILTDQPDIKQEAEGQKSEAPAQEEVSLQESKAQTGKAASTETDIPRERENEIKRLQAEGKRLQTELEGYQERYSLLGHKLAEVQRESKEEVEKVTQQLVELGMKLEEERRIYGREIVALTDQVIAERNRSAKEKETMDVEWKSLQMQIQKWEEIVTEKELENFHLRRQVKQKESELQGFRDEEARRFAAEKERKEQKAKRRQEKRSKFAENLQQPAEQLSTEQKPKEGAFSENLKPEQAEEFQQERSVEQLPAEGEFSENLQPLGEEAEHEEVEHTLSQEEIQQKLLHKAAPAVRAGGKRIKQSQTGPHISHKPSLVEQRDDKTMLEAFREAPEEMSKQLQVIEAIQEVERRLVQREVKMAGKKPTETKMFASTYFPHVPKNDDNQKIVTGGLNNFTVPQHGHTR